jgi:hypothetical protein
LWFEAFLFARHTTRVARMRARFNAFIGQDIFLHATTPFHFEEKKWVFKP